MGNQGRRVIMICLKVGEAIKIKVLGENKMLVHLISNALINDNNHFILQFRKEQANWKIPWRNLCNYLCLIGRILKLQLETWKHK